MQSHSEIFTLTKDNYKDFDYRRLSPYARSEDFSTNGRLLSAEQIALLEEKIIHNPKFKDMDMRFSKLYLKKELGIEIDRGGIILIQEEKSPQLYATYKNIPQLGQGGYGKVKAIQNLHTGEIKALKVLLLIKDYHLPPFLFEADVLSKLDRGHPIVFSKERAQDEVVPVKFNSYDEKICGKYYLVQSFVPGENLYKIANSSFFSNDDLLNVILQAIECVQAFHARGFIHGDIKEDNFIYDKIKKKLTLIDFGAVISNSNDSSKDFPLASVTLTLNYAAPERLKSAKLPTVASDIYALGCTIYYLVKNNPLLKDDLLELINHMLCGNPSQRIPLDKAIFRVKEYIKKYNINYSFDYLDSLKKEFPTREEQLSYIACRGKGISKNKFSILMLAAADGKRFIVQELLEKKADIRLCDAKGWTALHFAAFYGHADIVKTLLVNGAAINIQNGNGATPLIFAAYKGRLEVVKVLLDHGANLDSRDSAGLTALNLAIVYWHTEVEKLLRAKSTTNASSQNNLAASSSSSSLFFYHNSVPNNTPQPQNVNNVMTPSTK